MRLTRKFVVTHQPKFPARLQLYYLIILFGRNCTSNELHFFLRTPITNLLDITK